MSKGHTLEPDTKPATPPVETQAETLMLMLILYTVFIGSIVAWNIIQVVRRYKAYKRMNPEQQEAIRLHVARLNNKAVNKHVGPCRQHIWLEQKDEDVIGYYLKCGRCGKIPGDC